MNGERVIVLGVDFADARNRAYVAGIARDDAVLVYPPYAGRKLEGLRGCRMWRGTPADYGEPGDPLRRLLYLACTPMTTKPWADLARACELYLRTYRDPDADALILGSDAAAIQRAVDNVHAYFHPEGTRTR